MVVALQGRVSTASVDGMYVQRCVKVLIALKRMAASPGQSQSIGSRRGRVYDMPLASGRSGVGD